MPRPARATRTAVIAVLVAAIALITALPASAATLRPGSSGPAVSCWQKKLRWVALARPSSHVPLITVDGKYGTATTNATKAFQHATHLAEDGVAGDRTQTQMLAELGTAARDRKDEYAADLYYDRCGAAEPMVCRKVNGAPKIVKNPNDSNPHSIRYYASINCNKLDSGLHDQTAALYLQGATEKGVDARTVTRRTGLRQTQIDLAKSIVASSDTYTAYQSIALNGSVKFISAPGCRRSSSTQIVCEWASASYRIY